jgi:hypothetical protein
MLEIETLVTTTLYGQQTFKKNPVEDILLDLKLNKKFQAG